MKHIAVDSYTFYIAETIIEKTQGVIGRESLLADGFFVIPTCNWVHTYFLSNPLYVYFVSQDYNYIIASAVLSPYRLSRWERTASHVIESAISIPDELLLKFSENFLRNNSTLDS